MKAVMMSEDKKNEPGLHAPTENIEVKLVELRDDRNPIPPSIGGLGYLSIIFGPLANQPASDAARPHDQAYGLGGLLLLQVLVMLLIALGTISTLVQASEAGRDLTRFGLILYWCNLGFCIIAISKVLSQAKRARAVAMIFFMVQVVIGLIELYSKVASPRTESALGVRYLINDSLKILCYLACLVYFYRSLRVKLTFAPRVPRT